MKDAVQKLAPLTFEEMEAQVRAMREEHARIRGALSTAAENEPAPEPIGPAIVEAVEKLCAGIQPSAPSDLRRLAWKEQIVPRLISSKIPPRFHYDVAGRWNCLPQQRTFDACRSMFTGTGAIVALVGERGAGKTSIGGQLVVTRAWEDLTIFEQPETTGYCWRATPYRKLIELIARFKSIYADHGGIDTEALTEARDIFCRATLAIIDELHDCSDMRMRDRVLTDILDRRYGNMVDTLLITNETEEEFRASVGPSALSRITEHGVIIKCAWGSWREGDRRDLVRNGRTA